MSTILVTGGAGYVGSMVSRELLARGHRVVVADALLFGGEALLDLLSNPDFSFRRVDICVPADLEALFAAAAVRCGGPSRLDRRRSGLQGAATSSPPEPSGRARGTCFELSDRHGVGHFLFASTCSNYGKMEGDAVA